MQQFGHDFQFGQVQDGSQNMEQAFPEQAHQIDQNFRDQMHRVHQMYHVNQSPRWIQQIDPNFHQQPGQTQQLDHGVQHHEHHHPLRDVQLGDALLNELTRPNWADLDQENVNDHRIERSCSNGADIGVQRDVDNGVGVGNGCNIQRALDTGVDIGAQLGVDNGVGTESEHNNGATVDGQRRDIEMQLDDAHTKTDRIQ